MFGSFRDTLRSSGAVLVKDFREWCDNTAPQSLLESETIKKLELDVQRCDWDVVCGLV